MIHYNQTYYEKTGVKVTDKDLSPIPDKSLNTIVLQALDLANARYPSPMGLAKVQKWAAQYPQVPQFKNYLVTLYSRLHQQAASKATALDCYEKHPNYFFSRLTLADVYIGEENYDKAAELLDFEQDGAHFLQNQGILHSNEWMQYLYSMLQIAIAKKQMELASQFAERAWLYDAKHKLVKPMMDSLIAAQMSNRSLPNKTKIERNSVYKAHYQPTPTTQIPIFNHSKVADLYRYTLENLPKTLISDLMALPRTTLIADLRSMLQDAVARQEVLFQMAEDFEPTPKTPYLPLLDMPVHAMRFLAALNATEAFVDVLNFFRQEDEAFEYWSENLETECIEAIYLLGRNQLQAVQDFVLEGGNTYGARMTLSRMVAQVVLQEPERRDEVLNWFKTVIYKHLDNPEDAYLIDTAFLSFLIGDVLSIRGTELEPEIKRLFETGWIDEWVQGDLQAVQTELHMPQDFYDKLNLPETIFEFYEPKQRPAPSPDNNEILNKFSANKSPFEQFLFEYRMGSVQKGLANFQKSPETIKPVTPVLKAAPKQPVIQKVGRNDLCPCGSGKKYKKCHGT